MYVLVLTVHSGAGFPSGAIQFLIAHRSDGAADIRPRSLARGHLCTLALGLESGQWLEFRQVSFIKAQRSLSFGCDKNHKGYSPGNHRRVSLHRQLE